MTYNVKIILCSLMLVGFCLLGEYSHYYLHKSFEQQAVVRVMREVCDNGIDDDGDGLVDAFDLECSCNEFSNDNLVPNGDFESYSGRCFSLESDGVCLDDWYLVTSSPDYYQPEFDADEYQFLDDVGITYEGSIIGFGNVGLNRTESIGTCLSETLRAGSDYRFGISLATREDFFSELNQDFNLVFYGLEDCNDLLNYDSDVLFCDSPLAADAVELFKINMNSFPNNLAQDFQQQFTTQKNIEAILIYGECGQQGLGSTPAYFYMDNVEIYAVQSAFENDSQIRTVGSICDSDLVEITVDEQANISYQWYQDSLPLPNAVQHSYTFSLTDDRDSKFHLLVTGDTGCKLIGPYVFLGNHVEYTVANICQGHDYALGDTIVNTAGIYVRKVGVNAFGCDSVVRVDLSVAMSVDEEFTVEPELSVETNEVISIAPTQQFLDQLASYYWIENISGQRNNDPKFDASSSAPLMLDISFHYESLNGCTGTASFTLEWTSPPVITEICDNALDDDGDGLIDVFDIDCNCVIKNDMADYTMRGNVCTDEVSITLALVSGQSYQWYMDGVKMAGEVGNTLTIDKSLFAGKFHVAILESGNCTLLGPIEVQQGNLSQILNDTFCEGYSYDFEGRLITDEGSFDLVSEDEYGCLNRTTINLTLIPSSYNSIEATVCFGDPYFFGGAELYDAGIYQDTLFGGSSLGCDSIIELDLRVDEVVVMLVQDTICAGDVYDFGGIQLSESGIYEDTIISVTACDSIINVDLEVLNVELDTLVYTVFTGETYSYNGIEYGPGEYALTEKINDQFCDRVIALTILADTQFDIYIPNIFNPASSTDNKMFLIFSNRDITVREMWIYDRWGNEIFQRSNFSIDEDLESCWDGTYKGQLVSEGVYSYKILLDGENIEKELYQGQVTLVY